MGVTKAVLVGTVLVGVGIGGLGVAVKSVPSGEGVGVKLGGGGVRVAGSIGEVVEAESGGGVRVAGSIGAATGEPHEINRLANIVMTPKFTCRFIVILLSSDNRIRH